jgi:hypothetical protein
MANWPAIKPSNGRIGAIDRFCMATYQGSSEAARPARGIVPTLGFLCMVLILLSGTFAWHANAMERERDALIEQLHSERAARIEATLAAKDVEMSVAGDALETRVRRDLVDERMVQQQQRSMELERLAQSVEREKLVKADCVTPRSIIAAGL